MFTPNNFATYSPRLPAFKRNGEPDFGPPRRVPCGIVTLTADLKKTPPRSGTSASKGANDEDVAVAQILFRARDLRPTIGDRLQVAGLDLRFIGVEPRYSVFGNLDHYDCTFEAFPA